MKLEYRYYQKQAHEAYWNYICNNHGKHPLIVIPTAGGKSLLIAGIFEQIYSYPHTRALMVTHEKTLIQQNYNEFLNNTDIVLPDAGIYSAGLKSRDTHNRILFAGIQSIWKKAYYIGAFDIILVDEAHRIPQKSMGTYRKFLDEAIKINPNVIIVGLTATPFRMKGGILTEGKDSIFDDICYNVSIKELINPNHVMNLDNEQYLCPLISKCGNNEAEIDTSKLHIVAGDFKQNEMQDAFDVDEIVQKAVKDIISKTENRKKILIFTSGIEHCKHVVEELKKYTDKVDFGHSKRTNEENDKALEGLRIGQIKYLVNIDKWTTGMNIKDIDCIVLLRSTASPGLYSQIVGRGLRIHPDKKDCLILDYGQNIKRHGPIDEIEILTNAKTGKKEVSTCPQKECPNCHNLVHARVIHCPECGYEFIDEEKIKHEEKASEESILSEDRKPKEYEVKKVEYGYHLPRRQGATPSLRVDYYYDLLNFFSEYVCIEHSGYARQKAIQWLERRLTEYAEINSIEDALFHKDKLLKPTKILVGKDGKFDKIMGYDFNQIEEKKIQETLFDDEITDDKLAKLIF